MDGKISFFNLFFLIFLFQIKVGGVWQVFTGFTLNTNMIKLLFHDRHGVSGGNCFLVSAVKIQKKKERI
jgi:hypothetical protein